MSNSTISDNGAGIYNDVSSSGSSVFNSTMSKTRVEISIVGPGPPFVSMGNTVFKVSPGGHSIVTDGNPTVMSYGYNLSSDDGGGYLSGSGDQINTDPMLGPLQDSGGPTFTHELCLVAGDPNFFPPPYYDQRGPGFDRVRNGRIDIGSFEVQARTPRPTATPRPRSVPRPRPTPSH